MESNGYWEESFIFTDQPLLHCLDLLKETARHPGTWGGETCRQPGGRACDEVKPLLDFVAVILQDWLIEEVHEDVAGISNGGLVTLPLRQW